MKNVLFLSAIIAISLSFVSCEDLNLNLDDGELSTEDVVKGLKEALTIGTDSASTFLSATDGYFKGAPALAVIPLPDDVALVRNMINNNTTLAGVSSLIGLDQKFDDVIKGLNRAAEDAAKEAAPIFKSAITSLSISDGFDILQGVVPGSTKSTDFDSTAATQYLMNETYDALVGSYAPKINTSLDKDLIGNLSANDAWSSLTTTYNSFLNYSIEVDVLFGTVSYSVYDFSVTFMDEALPSSLNSDLGTFSTQLALNELFNRVGQEEIKIRRNPLQWASEIIQKVFGWVRDQFE
jgi:hypothetical protein